MQRHDWMRGIRTSSCQSCGLGALAVMMVSACVAGSGPGCDDPANLDEDIAQATAAIPAGPPDAAARFEPPSPGAPGIGDSLYPTLGNGGYEVAHYALDLRYETADPAQALDG